MLKLKGSVVIKIALILMCLTWVHCKGPAGKQADDDDDTVTVTNALDDKDLQTQLSATGNGRQYPQFAGCPLCDSSVYSYCSYKVFHDACCCDYPVMQLKPPQCWNYDCTLLYAKSCYEHGLIKNCCCNSPY